MAAQDQARRSEVSAMTPEELRAECARLAELVVRVKPKKWHVELGGYVYSLTGRIADAGFAPTEEQRTSNAYFIAAAPDAYAVAAQVPALLDRIAELEKKLSLESMNGAAIMECRGVIREIMGGNLAFIDDDVARCLITMRDQRDAAQQRIAQLERDAARSLSALKAIYALRPVPRKATTTMTTELILELAKEAIDAAMQAQTKEGGK